MTDRLEGTMGHLASYLKRLREQRHLSQSAVSEKAGLSDTYYHKIEKGERDASEDALMRILEALQSTDAERQQAVQLYAAEYLPLTFVQALSAIANAGADRHLFVTKPPQMVRTGKADRLYRGLAHQVAG